MKKCKTHVIDTKSWYYGSGSGLLVYICRKCHNMIAIPLDDIEPIDLRNEIFKEIKVLNGSINEDKSS